MGNPCPRVDLVGGPTPFEHMARVGAALGHKGLWVKRDDCMPLAFGGNKVRSLEYWVGAALAEGADMLVVAGALPSNQCRLTAAAGAKLGIEVTFLYAGEEDAPLPGNAMLTELRGAEIRRRGPVDEAERARLAAAEITRLRAAGRCPLSDRRSVPRGAGICPRGRGDHRAGPRTKGRAAPYHPARLDGG